MSYLLVLCAAVLLGLSSAARPSTLWTHEEQLRGGAVSKVHSPLPRDYVGDIPETFSWGNVNGTNYLTKNLNQHIPQYCGSCWAHAALSALGDRIKIARRAKGVDVNLAVQHVLNCGDAGSCHGGGIGAVYRWIYTHGRVAYDTCNPYIACSHESEEGFCSSVNTTCTPENVCRTCSTFSASGGTCAAITQYPNASVSEYGTVYGERDMMNEIYARGPIGCGVDASFIDSYHGGVVSGRCPATGSDHAVSVVGWGVEPEGTKYWVVRNSWGEYWGERGYFRVARGTSSSICLESTCYWGTPKTWTESNVPCNEDGSNCDGTYVDPSHSRVPFARQL